MPRPQEPHHVQKKDMSIQKPVLDKPQHMSPTNHRSPILNRPNQIIEMINESSSPPTPGHIAQSCPRNPLHLPLLLNSQPTQTTQTMSSDQQRPENQPQENRRRSEEERVWGEPPPRPIAPPPPHTFQLKQITVYGQPYGYTFNREPLYLQFGTHAAADAARVAQMAPPPLPPMPVPRIQYLNAKHAEDHQHYTSRQPRHYDEERYQPYDSYQRNYESYDGNREYDRRGETMRRNEDYDVPRYRHSTGPSEGPPIGLGPGPGPSNVVRQSRAEHDETQDYEHREDFASRDGERRLQRLPTTRTYRDFSRVPSMSVDSSERKRAYSSDEVRVAKRVRLNWSDELHAKFLEAVEELGVDKAVPTSIMKIMRVDGLTRENVASHLQKYRGTIKREKEEEERRLLLKAAAKNMEEHGAKMTEEEVLKAVAEREECYKAPAKKRGGRDR